MVEGTLSHADLKIEAVQADQKAIRHLKGSIAGGKHWYPALLEAISMWASKEEIYAGRRYTYLIDGEAFDWLLLAERLCLEIAGGEEEEKLALLFYDLPPIRLSTAEFKNLIGPAKYRAYLNYLYGVLVEEALLLATLEEARKEMRASGVPENGVVSDIAYQRLYGDSQAALLERFRKEKRLPERRSTNLGELKEFTYWLFKLRLRRSEKARVASDTKRALVHLFRDWSSKGRPGAPMALSA